MLLAGISSVQQGRQGVDMAVIAALKKKRVVKQDEKNCKNVSSFHTPARFGWGMVAMELHPKHAKVWY